METQVKFVMGHIREVYGFMISQNVALKKAGVEVPEDALESLALPGLQAIIYDALRNIVAKSLKEHKTSAIARHAEQARTLALGTTERIDALIDLTKAVADEIAQMAIRGLESLLSVPGLPEQKVKESEAAIERLKKSAERIETLITLVDRRSVARNVGLKVLIVYDHLAALQRKEDEELDAIDSSVVKMGLVGNDLRV